MDHDGNHQATEVQVIGGGLGGLAAAALIAAAGRTVTVHEGRGRLGGRATTDSIDGHRFNQGPHALYLGGEAHRVLRLLGITTTGLAPVTRGALMADGDLVGLAPGGPVSLLRSRMLGVRDKAVLARILAGVDRLDPAPLASVCADDWVDGLTTRPRVREILHAVIRLATYCARPEALSADVALMQVQLTLGDGVIYLDDGWEQLVSALTAVPGVRIERDHNVRDLPDAAVVIVATGGPESAGRLVGTSYDVGPAAEVSVLDVGLERPPRHDVVLGIDPPIYLSNHGHPAGMSPTPGCSTSVAEYLRQGVQPDRARLRSFLDHAGVAPNTIAVERYLHRMSAVTAIATAARGGLRGRPPASVADQPGVFVVGDWVGPRGHLLDGVLASAEDAAYGALAHLAQRSRVL